MHCLPGSPGQKAVVVAASRREAERNQPERENKESQASTPSEIVQKIRDTASPDSCPVTEEVPGVGTRVLHKVKVRMRAAEIATIDFVLDIEKSV